MLYADVIVDISAGSVDRTYQYGIPSGLEDKVDIGTPVVIPFGKGGRTVNGYVVGISKQPKIGKDRLKRIESVPEGELNSTQALISLAYWMKEYYGSTLNEAIKTTMPVKRKVREAAEKSIVLKISEESAKELFAALSKKKNAAARVRLLGGLMEAGKMDYGYALKELAIPRATIASLEKKGVIGVESRRAYRMPRMDGDVLRGNIALSPEQAEAVNGIVKGYMEHSFKQYLLHGVTGSGKTEVYMAVIEKVIADGRQVIMLIPEIALTYQTVRRFYGRFKDRVAVLNSRMSQGERYDQYERVKNGGTDIIIGPRSALFAPFERLGLIIIDEEHEDSYKSETPPKYHAREAAAQLARIHNAVLLLGSATPSVDTYYRTEPDYPRGDGIIKYELEKRATGSPLPEVTVVDMREEMRSRNYSMLSRTLHDKIAERLAKKEQVMLFINRRGYAGFVSCRSCGESIKCPNCDISLTIHHAGGGDKMICHMCGYETPAVKKCPKCASPYIGGFGAGTQKVEEMVGKMFPSARILRMDADTTSGKSGHEKILKSFANHEADILIGTQMIVKGHDFPRVTLVGILAADMTLHLSDFHASEKTFELIVQAAGRAGRGSLKGEVVVQTYKPEHYAISCAAKQDYKSFFTQEMAYRKLMKYPPAAHMMTVFISSDSEKLSHDIAKASYAMAGGIAKGRGDTAIIGPARHPVFKANNAYRYLMHVKTDSVIVAGEIRRAIAGAAEREFAGRRYVMQFDMQ